MKDIIHVNQLFPKLYTCIVHMDNFNISSNDILYRTGVSIISQNTTNVIDPQNIVIRKAPSVKYHRILFITIMKVNIPSISVPDYTSGRRVV